jgi:hypothetical protein
MFCTVVVPVITLTGFLNRTWKRLILLVRGLTRCGNEDKIRMGADPGDGTHLGGERRSNWSGEQTERDRATGYARVKNADGVWVRPEPGIELEGSGTWQRKTKLGADQKSCGLGSKVWAPVWRLMFRYLL